MSSFFNTIKQTLRGKSDDEGASNALEENEMDAFSATPALKRPRPDPAAPAPAKPPLSGIKPLMYSGSDDTKVSFMDPPAPPMTYRAQTMAPSPTNTNSDAVVGAQARMGATGNTGVNHINRAPPNLNTNRQSTANTNSAASEARPPLYTMQDAAMRVNTLSTQIINRTRDGIQAIPINRTGDDQLDIDNSKLHYAENLRRVRRYDLIRNKIPQVAFSDLLESTKDFDVINYVRDAIRPRNVPPAPPAAPDPNVYYDPDPDPTDINYHSDEFVYDNRTVTSTQWKFIDIMDLIEMFNEVKSEPTNDTIFSWYMAQHDEYQMLLRLFAVDNSSTREGLMDIKYELIRSQLEKYMHKAKAAWNLLLDFELDYNEVGMATDDTILDVIQKLPLELKKKFIGADQMVRGYKIFIKDHENVAWDAYNVAMPGPGVPAGANDALQRRVAHGRSAADTPARPSTTRPAPPARMSIFGDSMIAAKAGGSEDAMIGADGYRHGGMAPPPLPLVGGGVVPPVPPIIRNRPINVEAQQHLIDNQMLNAQLTPKRPLWFMLVYNAYRTYYIALFLHYYNVFRVNIRNILANPGNVSVGIKYMDAMVLTAALINRENPNLNLNVYHNSPDLLGIAQNDAIALSFVELADYRLMMGATNRGKRSFTFVHEERAYARETSRRLFFRYVFRVDPDGSQFVYRPPNQSGGGTAPPHSYVDRRTVAYGNTVSGRSRAAEMSSFF